MEGCLTDNTLSAFLENHLSPAERALVERHIDCCEPCRKLIGTVAATLVSSECSAPPDWDIAELIGSTSWQPPSQIDEYRLLKPLGRGQMGQVYAAYDQTLKRYVAIKLLHKSEPDNITRERLQTEACANAQLKHPAIVDVYRAGSVNGHPYIVSEFVAGKSLDRIQCALPWREVLRMGLDVARGLQASHEAGILHRDIKPANIILSDSGAVKLLDFGLAKFMTTSTGEPATDAQVPLSNLQMSLTRTCARVGTPRYMAPEVWLREPATPQSDLYSVGCVLYELCAGRPPFSATDTQQLKAAVLKGEPEPLNSIADNIDSRLVKIVMRCLRRNPAERPSSARSLCAELEALAAKTALPVSRSRIYKLLALVMLLMGLLSAGLMALRHPERMSHPQAAGSGTKVRHSIAILGFQNMAENADLAWLSTAFAEMMRSELAGTGELRLVSGEQIYQMKHDLGLSETGSLSSSTLRKIQNYLAVELVLSGSFALQKSKVEQGIRLDYRLFDTGTAATLAESFEVAQDGDLFSLVERSGKTLKQRLGVLAAAEARTGMSSTSLLVLPSALRAYSEGLDAMRREDLRMARERLELAAQQSPRSPRIQVSLALIYEKMGLLEKQRDAARLALSLSDGMPLEEQLSISASYYASLRDFKRAVEIQQQLIEHRPDNIDYRLTLAWLYNRADEPRKSLELLDKLRKEFADSNKYDPRIELETEFAYRELSDFKSAIQADQRLIKQGYDRGSTYLVARGHIAEGWAQNALGNYDKAEYLFDSAIENLQKIDMPHDMAWALIGSANSKLRMGKLSGALSMYERQISLSSAHNNYIEVGFSLLFSASVQQCLGHIQDAMQRTEEVGHIAQEYHISELNLGALVQLTNLYLISGNLHNAQKTAFDLRMENPRDLDERGTGMILAVEGPVHYMSGDVDDGRSRLESAIVKFDAVHDVYRAILARITLAELSLDYQQAAAAEQLSQAAAVLAMEKGAKDLEVHSLAVLVQALALQGRQPEAAKRLAALGKRGIESESMHTRLAWALASAGVHSTSKRDEDLQAARAELTAARRLTDEIAFAQQGFRVKLALSDILRKLGKGAEARRLLQEQAAHAQILGFRLFERQALARLKL